MAEAATTEKRSFEADVSRLLHLMVHSVYSDRDVFLRELISNAADACEKLRYEAIAEPSLLGDDPAARIVITPRCGQAAAVGRGQWHRHEPRRGDRGAGHHRPLRNPRLHGAGRGGQGNGGARAGRPVRHRLLLGLHGGRAGRRADPASRQRRGLDVVVRRQGRVLDRRRRPCRGTGARHARGRPSHGGRQGLHRALQARAHRHAAVRPCAGADLDRRKARRTADPDRRRQRAVDQAEERDQPRPTMSTSTAASPASTTSRR